MPGTTTVLRHHAFQWHITNKCNLRCAHCYQSDYSEEIDPSSLIEILDKYERFLSGKSLYGHIFLTGGEPLTSEHFFFLTEEIVKRGFRLSILTNGTLIDREAARRIAALRPCFVQISLDGTPKIHDEIRGKGSFDAAMRGVDCLKEAGVTVMISFTAQKSNYRCLPALARICKKHKVDKLWWDRVVTETPEDAERLALTTEQFRQLCRTAGRLNGRYRPGKSRFFVSCERSLQFLGCRDPLCGYYCKAGGNMFILLPDGSVMPCRRLPFVIGNIHGKEFDEIIASSAIVRDLKNARLPADCRNCPHTEFCNGGAKCVTYGQTGELFARDVNCFYQSEKRSPKK